MIVNPLAQSGQLHPRMRTEVSMVLLLVKTLSDLVVMLVLGLCFTSGQ